MWPTEASDNAGLIENLSVSWGLCFILCFCLHWGETVPSPGGSLATRKGVEEGINSVLQESSVSAILLKGIFKQLRGRDKT